MFELKTITLFALTAFAEIIGCYLPYLWLKQGKSIFLLIPATISLTLFVWLLSLHPAASGRVYAAYGGMYVFVSLLWLWIVDGIKPVSTDIIGGLIVLLGMLVIILGSKST
ncbi:YnfA family protein [Psychromonas algicola]|uniref:YnfA family protein n=1 Tax=Psychromonas algicola TaxID=2555642 RepID=UPI00106834BC|nr:YnfA family protein [Psychromonas sp. RZ5]TEW51507.1 YnfA family protein [Psychromonas sp. RZ5]